MDLGISASSFPNSIAVLIPVMVSLIGSPIISVDTSKMTADMACGPRCVSYVLRSYGLSSPQLVALVEQMQLPAIDRGSTLENVRTVLEQHGIPGKGVQFDIDRPLRWPYPAILHYKPDAGQSGHFVVWLPSSEGSRAQIWNGLLGIQEEDWPDLSKRLSGAALLTVPPGMNVDDVLVSEKSQHMIDVLLRLTTAISAFIFCGSAWTYWKASRLGNA